MMLLVFDLELLHCEILEARGRTMEAKNFAASFSGLAKRERGGRVGRNSAACPTVINLPRISLH